MLRKSLVSLAVSSIVYCSSSFALELGELTLLSAKNEPLKAEIQLRDTANLGPREVLIRLGSESEFRQAGIPLARELSQLRFAVTQREGALFVDVSSQAPITADELRFVIAARWPSGQLVREYQSPINQSVLVDKNAESVVQSSTLNSSTTTAFATEKALAQGLPTQQELGVIKGNTLWSIADQNNPNNRLTIYQTMMAIQALNENAFYANNINLLKEGSVLRLPTQEQIALFNQVASKAEFERQHAAWLALKQAGNIPKDLNQAQLNTQAAPKEQPKIESEAQDQLTLVSGASVLPEASGSSNDGESAKVAELETELSATKELLDKENREKQDLNHKLAELTAQQQTLEQLIQLKDEQMAELQRQIVSAQQIMQEQKNTVDQLLEADQQRRERELLEEQSLSNQLFNNPIVLSVAAVVMMMFGVLIGFLLRRKKTKSSNVSGNNSVKSDAEFNLVADTPVAPVAAAVAVAAVAPAAMAAFDEDRPPQAQVVPPKEIEEEDPFAFDFDTPDELDDDVLVSNQTESSVADDFDFDLPEDDDEFASLDDKMDELTDDTEEFFTTLEDEVSELESDLEEDLMSTGVAEADNTEEEDFVSNLLNDDIGAVEDPFADSFDSVEEVIEETLTDSDDVLSDDLEIPDFGEQEALEEAEVTDDEEEFDFFDASGDETATKLDLARAYMDMGDEEGARSILEDVLETGNTSQIVEAQNMLERMV